MALIRVGEKGTKDFGTVTWTNNKAGGKTTYEIAYDFSNERCHCHTHHRFCCLAGSKLDEGPVHCDTRIERESQDSTKSQGKARSKRRRSSSRRRRLKKAMERISKT